jgi:predicted peptidase
MKRALKIIGIIALVIAIGIAWIAYKFLTTPPEIMAPEDYETSVHTGGEIEAKYLAHGTFEVSYFEEETSEEWAKYEVYYPKALESGTEKYPVIVVANGSGVRASRYPAVFNHYASWGFIVIGNEHDTSYAGDSSDASLAYLIKANDDPSSVLYRKVDLDNVGIVGHSQGGVGTFAAITAQEHSDMYKAAVSLSPVPEESAKAIHWDYDPTKIKIPVLIFAGEENDVILTVSCGVGCHRP